MSDGVAFATDWWAIIFNPSMPYRFAHMLLASGLTVAFLIAGVSAFRWLRRRPVATVCAPRCAPGVRSGAILIPVQIFVGDLHGLNTLEYQPAKVAAMEGNWETAGPTCRCCCSPSRTKTRAEPTSRSASPISPRSS